MWMTAAAGSPPPEGEKKSKKIGREQIVFVSLSWMEYFSFTFLLMLCGVSSAGSQGFGYSSFPTEKLCFFRTTFLLKQKGYCPGKDFDFMLLKWGNFFLQQLPSGFHSTFAPATSLGCLALSLRLDHCRELHPWSLTLAWLSQQSKKTVE